MPGFPRHTQSLGASRRKAGSPASANLDIFWLKDDPPSPTLRRDKNPRRQRQPSRSRHHRSRNRRRSLADRDDWKSVDDYLPMLKYGTQLPPPSQVVTPPPAPPPVLFAQRVTIADFDIPFGSVLKIAFKWMAAAFIIACCFLPVIIVVWLIIMAVFAGLIGGAMSSLHHP